ncbi:MAG: hypothetical protein M3Z03_01385 [Actinomycetota bacterium]|nr:hypothetical protein [Actinomycetota bacterium]
MFAISVPSLALVVILGLVAVAAIAWLLSPRDLTIDVEGLADDRPNRRRP